MAMDTTKHSRKWGLLKKWLLRKAILCVFLTFCCVTGAGCDSQPEVENPNATPADSVAAQDAPKPPSVTQPEKKQTAAPVTLGSLGDLVASSDPDQGPTQVEVFNELTTKELGRLFEWVTNPDDSKFEQLNLQDARLNLMRPKDLISVFNQGGLEVSRWTKGTKTQFETKPREAVSALVELFSNAKKTSRKLKTVRVAIDESMCQTNCRVALDGDLEDRRIQIHAQVRCEWAIRSGQPILTQLEVMEYEEVTFDGKSALYQECTPSLMGSVTAHEEQLGKSCDYWAQRIDKLLGANFMGYQGVSVGDVNGDLLDDVYVCQMGGLPNLLLLQNADGTATSVGKKMGVDLLDSSRCALFVDLDNDGDQDLVVASLTGTLFYERVVDKFEFRHRVRASRLGYSLAAADYDLDGDVDVYACCYHATQGSAAPNPVPYFDANNGSSNVLIANDGDWQFHDATAETGLNKDNTRWSYAASWEDYDNDGDFDLYVANDFGRNCLYRNELIENRAKGGKATFVNVAGESGVEDVASGMSAAWGDYNRDGRMDLYISNMFSSAGERITYQRKFFEEDEGAREKLRRLARGNSLFMNGADGFNDVTLDAAVEMGRWAWGSTFCDLNNDGWQDLFVANGNYTGEDSGDL